MSGPYGGWPDTVARHLATALRLTYGVHAVVRARPDHTWRARIVAGPLDVPATGGTVQITSRATGTGVRWMLRLVPLTARAARRRADAHAADPDGASRAYAERVRQLRARYPDVVTIEPDEPTHGGTT